MKNNQYKRYICTALSIFGGLGLSILLCFILFQFDVITDLFGNAVSAVMPFVIGGALAYIVCPLCNRFQNLYMKLFSKVKDEKKQKSISSGLSVLSVMVITLAIIYIIIIILVPQLISSIIKIVQILPESTQKLVDWLQKMLASNETLLKYSQQVIDNIYSFMRNWLSNGLLESLQNVAAGLSNGVVNAFVGILNVFIGFIVAIYFLLSRKKLAGQAKLILYSVFKKKIADAVYNEVKYADKVFSGFINGKILDSVVISIICYIGLMLFKVISGAPATMSETLIAVVVGIFNLIPFFGWYIGLILSSILILMVSPAQCIFFIIFDIVIQQIDGNILGPKIIGNNTGVSSFWVLFSVLLFGYMWGFVGMVIGTPVFAVIYHIIKQLVFKGLKKRGQESLAEEYAQEFYSESTIKTDDLNENVNSGADDITGDTAGNGTEYTSDTNKK